MAGAKWPGTAFYNDAMIANFLDCAESVGCHAYDDFS